MTDKEVKYVVAINFSQCISQEQNLRKVAKLLFIFLTTPDKAQSSSSDNFKHHYNIEITILSEPELQMINTKPVIKKIKMILKLVEKV